MKEPRQYSISGFCREYGVSRTTFYRWRASSRGPIVTKVRGNGPVILIEHARAWWRKYGKA